MIYSGVPAHLFGLKQEIEIGRMSGKSNVIYWLNQNHIESTPERVEAILKHAHQSAEVLTSDQILEIVRSIHT